ncbi:hypothetical protein RSOLAG1IB_07238 [Rhizoctonia solani AG-1 IB]|uniref:Uncharacterized protein n=1 Tax=Thanatephorus cucumeris (strain AG1-IB / isolate 7/3/14) TaxID=1108050 RepID=A0A0B7FCS7_THACB|nr:hypothetical protein RSOLAG1IB_07238 [Rhizoctonia solani AG-1 IB]
MHEREDAAEELSEVVELVLAEQMLVPNYDEILDRNTRESHTAFITKSKALLLLGILFKSRKGLLGIWYRTRLPTLTELLFATWRVTHITK